MPSIDLEFGTATHRGRVRQRNEDYFEADPEAGIWLVADGVGGHAGGAEASKLAARSVHAELAQGCSALQAMQSAHTALLQHAAQHEQLADMGSTAVLITFDAGDYQLTWVGDSRAYQVNERGRLQQLTRDHTRGQQRVDAGELSATELRTHPDRNLLTQCLGVATGMTPQPRQVAGSLAYGERIVLCSDGLTDELDDNDLSKILVEHGGQSLQLQVKALLKAALDAGGRDNITVVMIGEPATTKQSEPPESAKPDQAR